MALGVATTRSTMTEDSFVRLTDDQRVRLRRSVNPVALERLLASMPRAERPLVLLSFCADVAASEMLDALRAAGISETEIRELRPFADYAPPPPHLAHSENDLDPDWVAPRWPVHLSLQPPNDPELRVLWGAVEPSRGAA